MDTRTKIICTMGPAVNRLEQMIALIEAGMNVARLNFSHGSHAEHLVTINLLRQAREQLGVPLAIMLDTKGPEMRVGQLPEGGVKVERGHKLWLVASNREGEPDQISINPGEVIEVLEPGMHVLFDDGYVSSTVLKVDKGRALLSMDNGGCIGSGKGVNIPDAKLNLPAMTEQDIRDIKFACKHDIDIVAASFIRSPEHVIAIKSLLEEEGRSKVLVLAKVENKEGVRNFDQICQAADGIMIARGDLGVEVPLSQVPGLQKMMIRHCYMAGKPSVTATQMLESMIHNPRPTRAEASDVANAIYDSTSVVMLSGETAVGKYPIEAVQTMKAIIREAEADFDYDAFFGRHSALHYNDVPSAVTLAAVKTANSAGATALLAFTSSGHTARMLSRLRPKMPIIAATCTEKNYHQLAFNWGVLPCIVKETAAVEDAFAKVSELALKEGHVKYGDLVVMTAGSPFGVSGTTNTMIVDTVGEVLVRGHQGYGKAFYGNVVRVLGPEEKEPYAVRDKVLLISRCNHHYDALIKQAAGVLLENHIADSESEGYLLQQAERYGKAAITRADGAFATLSEGQLVTMEPSTALVYKGVMQEILPRGERPQAAQNAS